MRIGKPSNLPMRQVALIALVFSLCLPILAAPVAAQVSVPAPASPVAAPGTSADSSVPADSTTAVVKPKAIRDPVLYQANVTLISQSDAERQNATAQALMQVIVKLTGNPQAPLNTVIRKALPQASSLVVQSAANTAPSDSEGNTAIGGVPIYKTTLSVSFDPVAVDLLIAGAGLKYWTGARPKPMLWLAIDDGRGARLVTAQQINVVKPLAAEGLNRGLHFLLPAGTSVEQAATAAIWNLDAAALTPLSARYQNNTQLLGKMYRSVSGWSIWWVLSQDGVEIGRWPVTDADPQRAIASGADFVVDAMAKREAVYLPIGAGGSYLIDVVGIANQVDFLRVMAYLQNQPIVQKVSVVEVTPDHLRLQLDLRVGVRGFRVLVESGDTLRALDDVPEGSPEGSTPATASVGNADSEAVPRFGLK
jgi:hypothetical protein